MRQLILVLPLLALALVAGPASVGAQPIDLEFRHARVDDILRALARHTGENITIRGEIPDSVSVRLSGLSLDEALQTLLGGTGYTWSYHRDTWRVLPAATEVNRGLTLRYSAAKPLAEVLVRQFPELRITAEEHSNSLLVSGPLSMVEELQVLVEGVDQYRAQVRIRAEMVEVSLDAQEVRGVDLDALLDGAEGSVGLATGFSTGNEAVEGSARTIQGDFDLQAFVHAMQEDRDARLLSSPHITTLDNQPAKIHVGERVPYQRATTETATGATLAEVDFIDVGVQLDVTPTISGDDLLYLQVHSEVSEVLDQSVQNIPRIGTREADTRVLVRSGDTVVIGGLIKDNEVKVEKKVPILGDIPVLGWLFKRRTVQRSQTELLVFIHPERIAEPAMLRATAAQAELGRPSGRPTER